jgi:hypothetical protein
MTFEEIFIQKEGAMKVTIGIIGVPYEIFNINGDDPVPL